MSMVGSPISELTNNRNLTDEDLIKAIRFAVEGEYEAAQTFIQLAESIDNKLAAKVLKSVADIKREHMGNILKLSYELSPDEENSETKGAKEIEDRHQENEV